MSCLGVCLEHTHWAAAYDGFAAYDAEVGEDDLPLVAVGEMPIHDFLLNLAGYGSGYYQLSDHRREVEQWPRHITLDRTAE